MTTPATVTDRSALAQALRALKLSGMLKTLDARFASAGAGVKVTPSGWPAASLDTGCGRQQPAPVQGVGRRRSTNQDPPNGSLYGTRGLP